MLLKIALNGARPKTENKNIPRTIEEIAAQVKDVFNFGYNVFHIHCYNQQGVESLVPGDVEKLVTSVKQISQDIQIGISTGDWIEPDLKKRINYINNWNVMPDFVSVNMIEDNVHEICSALIKRGVLIEAGLNELQAAEIFINSGIEPYCTRILVEPESEILDEAIKTVNEIENVLNNNNSKTRRLLHGFNAVSWPLLREAKKRGYDSRIGIEDTIYDENGKMINSNLELIMSADKILKDKS
jgi:uncharacterized protein (DUF849 family)